MRNILAKNLAKAVISLNLVFTPFYVFATDIIRDSEIENIVREIGDPVMRAAGLKPEEVEIYIINDNAINAFTTGAKDIYINSGLIKNFSNPDTLRGVMAHEIGHIVGRHAPMRGQESQDYALLAMSAVGVGLLASGNLKDPSPGFAIALGGVHYAERMVLHYSRIDESIADKSAMRYLEASGNTSKGLVELMEKLYAENRGISKYVNPYDLTHPLSEARLTSIKRFYATSKHKNSSNSEALKRAYQRAQVKLNAFTEDEDLLLKLYGKKDDELAKYAKAIIYFRKGNKDLALSNIDQLLAMHPDDPYLNELKGQILLKFGSKEAIKYFDEALSKLPNDNLITLSNAIVRLNIYAPKSEELKNIEAMLKKIIAREKNNLTAFYYLSLYYDRLGLKSKSQLQMAILFNKKGDLKMAKKYAKQAIKGLPSNSPEWFQANDILSVGE
jgi:predicted Zn-dependent protease